MGWTIGEIMAGAQAVKALKGGASMADIDFSKVSGIDPNDVRALRTFTMHSRMLIVIRCPPPAALAWHGTLQPKTYAASKQGLKSDDRTGVAAAPNGRMYVSDYDLMSIWRNSENGTWTKVVATGINPEKPSAMSEDAATMLRSINSKMVSRFQHGCQDDWNNAGNRGVKKHDRFALFIGGKSRYIPNPNEMKEFYGKHFMEWPYDTNGHYKLS